MEAIPLLGISLLFIVKILVMIALGIYLVFALIVVRQISLMTTTLEVGFELPLKLLGYVHLALAVIVLLISLFIL